MSEVLSFQLLEVGCSTIPGPELFWMSHFDETFPLSFQVALLKTQDAVVLLNAGPQDNLETMNSHWALNLGAESAMKVSPDGDLVSQLSALGVSPSDVTHVVLSPFQLYSTGGLSHFSDAEVCLSRRGWVHLLTTKHHPHDSKAHSINDATLVHLVTDGWEKLRFLEDEDEIVPGVKTWWTGTHHRASIATDFTFQGKNVLWTDAIFYLDNLTRRHPIGVCESIEEAMAFFDRAQGYDIVFPMYDPSNRVRFSEEFRPRTESSPS